MPLVPHKGHFRARVRGTCACWDRCTSLQLRFTGAAAQFVAFHLYLQPRNPTFQITDTTLALIPPKMVSLQTPFIPMSALLSRFWFSLRFVLLAATVLLVLGLNERAVSVLRLPVGTGTTRVAKATVVKQKVLLEATAAVKYLVAPLAEAWLPTPATATAWLPALRRALAVPRLRAGIRAGEVFRARLLAVALSPQAP